MKDSTQSLIRVNTSSQLLEQQVNQENHPSFPSVTDAAARFNKHHPGFKKSTTCGLLCKNLDESGTAIIGDGLLDASSIKSEDLNPSVSRFFRSCQIDDFLNELNFEDGLGPRLSDISMTKEDVNRYFDDILYEFDQNDEQVVTSSLAVIMLNIFREKSGIKNSRVVVKHEWGMLAGGLLAFASHRDPNLNEPAAFALKADFVTLNENKSKIKACLEVKKESALSGPDTEMRSSYGLESKKTKTIAVHYASGAKFTLLVTQEGFCGIFNKTVSRDPDEKIESYMTPTQGLNQFDFFHVRHALCLALYGIARISAHTIISQYSLDHSVYQPRIEDAMEQNQTNEQAVQVKKVLLDIDGEEHSITGLNHTNCTANEKKTLESIGELLHLQELERGVENDDVCIETLNYYKLYLLDKYQTDLAD